MTKILADVSRVVLYDEGLETLSIEAPTVPNAGVLTPVALAMSESGGDIIAPWDTKQLNLPALGGTHLFFSEDSPPAYYGTESNEAIETATILANNTKVPLVAGGTYYWQVMSFLEDNGNPDNYSLLSNIQSFTMPAGSGPDGIPTLSNGVAINANTISFNIVDGATNETGIAIEVDTGGGYSEVTEANANATFLQLGGMPASRAIDVRSRNRNLGGLSVYSNVITVTTPAAQGGSGGSGDFTVSGTIVDKGTISLTASVSNWGLMDGDIKQFSYGDEYANGTPVQNSSASIGWNLTCFVTGVGDDTNGDILHYSNANLFPNRSGVIRREHDTGNGIHRAGGFGFAYKTPMPGLFVSYFRYFKWPGGSERYNDYIDADGNPQLAIYKGANLKQYYFFGDGEFDDGNVIKKELPQPILVVSKGGQEWTIATNADTSPGGWSIKDDQASANMGDPNWVIKRTDDKWQQWENYHLLNLNKNVYDGKTRVWMDGELGMYSDTVGWQSSSFIKQATGWRDFRLGYMDDKMVGCTVDFADYYVATTMARVVMCSESTWAAATWKIIQPVRESNWASNTQINSITVNQGPFDTVIGKYLYVVKSDGNAFNANGLEII